MKILWSQCFVILYVQSCTCNDKVTYKDIVKSVVAVTAECKTYCHKLCSKFLCSNMYVIRSHISDITKCIVTVIAECKAYRHKVCSNFMFNYVHVIMKSLMRTLQSLWSRLRQNENLVVTMFCHTLCSNIYM